MANEKVVLGMASLKVEGEITNFDDGVPISEMPYVEEPDHEPMTVGDLIAILQKHPKNLRVFVRGYESGVDDPVVGAVRRVALNVNKGSGVYGWHARVRSDDEWESDMAEDEPMGEVDGLVIDRP